MNTTSSAGITDNSEAIAENTFLTPGVTQAEFDRLKAEVDEIKKMLDGMCCNTNS